jgi:uracil phosphoribosyltransferase
VDTPCGRAPVEFVDPSQPVVCVPILRAGLVLLEQAATVLPAHITYHFGARRRCMCSLHTHNPSLCICAHCARFAPGVSRDEKTLQPRVYLNNLPAAFAPGARILVSDPMIATGASSPPARADAWRVGLRVTTR